MELFVIVLSLLSERYLVHAISLNRFEWFPAYFNAISQGLSLEGQWSHPAIVLTVVMLPLLLLYSTLLFFLGHFFFGFIGFLLNFIVFYYCLGPENPFYPVRQEGESNEVAAGNYCIKVNRELFAVIFWYIIAGPIAVLFYRLLTLCCTMERTAGTAQYLTNLLDWIPARLTVFLYLLAGNFQQGWKYWLQNLLTPPANNDQLLNEGGLRATRENADGSINFVQAENLVTHATLILLVIIALCTLVAFL